MIPLLQKHEKYRHDKTVSVTDHSLPCNLSKNSRDIFRNGHWTARGGIQPARTKNMISALWTPRSIARPVYVRRDDRIKAHFLTCFLALLIYKCLEKKVNRGGRHFTTEEIVGTLRSMDFVSIAGEGYVPAYTRTDLTNHLHGSAGFSTDRCVLVRSPLTIGTKQSLSTTKSEKNHNPQIASTAVWGLDIS